MRFFREKRVIEFDDKKVELYEIDIKSLMKLANNEYKNNYELILDNSNLSEEDFEAISIEALKKIEEEFLELNSKHFDNKGEKTDKKKILNLISLLISHNHKNPEEYGLSAFLLAIEQIYEEKEELIKHIAIANRIARFAKDSDFREFISEKEKVNLDEVESFSI